MYGNFKKDFGKKVKYYRTLANLSQEKLAERVGISVNTVSYIEHGKNSISFSKLPALCRALSIEPHQLFIDIECENENKIEKINKILKIATPRQLNIIQNLIVNILDMK